MNEARSPDTNMFLYPEGTAYNELELDKDLFHVHIFRHICSSYILSSSCDIFQGLHTILMGKSSAVTGHRSASKPSQAEMRGMWQVPKAVAYAAFQVRVVFLRPLSF